MSVNVSVRQVADADVVADVEEALGASGLSPEALTVETTESLLMERAGPAVATLRGLRELGVRISIDDFGTGYSSLAYLRRLRVDEIKIDREFVTGLGRDRSDTAIVAAVVNLAHTLRLDVVAEGVESAAQVSELRAAGCDRAQGYVLSPPLRSEEADAVLVGGPRPLVEGARGATMGG